MFINPRRLKKAWTYQTPDGAGHYHNSQQEMAYETIEINWECYEPADTEDLMQNHFRTWYHYVENL